MIVGVDCDEVIYPFVAQFREWMVTRHDLDPATLPTPDLWKLGEAWGLTEDQWQAEFTAAIRAGVLFGKGDPLDGAVSGLQRLCESGHDVFVVTARNVGGSAGHDAALSTYRWLADLGVPFSGIILSHDKGIVETDIFFEDFHQHYEALDEEFETFPILMTRPWNVHLDEARRVADWPEFVEVVEFLTMVCDEAEDDPQFVMRDAWEARNLPASIAADSVTEL